MDTLYIEKFLSQVHRKLKEQGISNSKLREDCIEVFEGENVIFKIDAKGYRILTQLAYDMNPRLPGLNKQAGKN